VTGPADEAVHEPRGEGFADAATVSFGDQEAELYGFARIGLQPGAQPTGSVLAVLFAGSEIAEVLARGEIELSGEPSWDSVTVDALSHSTERPLEAWRLRWDGVLDLALEAVSSPMETAAGGMEGYDQICRVSGTATAAGRERKVSCLGQRGHTWGVADWERMQLARTLSAWWDEDHALVLSAVRPAKAKHHADEEVTAHLLDVEPVTVAEPRLSTTYDAEGRQRRAGLELYVTGEDDEFPRRVSGHVACGTSLDLGRLRLDCSFFEWRSQGRSGVGRYDVLRRV
jgi:hypothetical protein